MEADLELHEVRERPAETTGLVTDTDLNGLKNVEASLIVKKADVELQEVHERPPETLGLVGDTDRTLHDDEASVDETSW